MIAEELEVMVTLSKVLFWHMLLEVRGVVKYCAVCTSLIELFTADTGTC